MLGLGIAMVVIGIVFLFIFPWAGIPLGIFGLILLIVYFVGSARRPAER
jgi:hypothetical protein